MTAKSDGHYFCSTITNTELLPFPKSTVHRRDYIYHIYQYSIYRGFPGGITLPTKVHIIKSYGFSSSHAQRELYTCTHVHVRAGPSRRLVSAEELMLSNCGAGKRESVELQGGQTSQS